MKILILNGSPRPNGNTVAMIHAYAEGAAEAGHTSHVVDVCRMKIGGCLACEYCHTKGNGTCIQKDDMQADEKKALATLERITEKWTPKYPNSMKRWKNNWDVISPIFKFSATIRKVIYTTNAIESLNSTYRKLNRQRSVFPSDTALLKALYLATFEATKKWTTTIRNRAWIYEELSIMYEGRLPE